jgi:hypothetical protein
VSAYVGETFSSDYTTSGTTLANVFSTPTLPPGLRFTLIASSSAVLSGIPTTISPSINYLFYGSGGGNTVSSIVSIQVLPTRVLTSPSTFSPQTLTVNSPFDGLSISNALVPSNNLSFSGTLPPGLIFSPLVGRSTTISGTPTVPQSGTFNAIITVTDVVTGASTNIAIPFVYREVVQFTYPTSPITVNLYSNIPVSNTAGIPNVYNSNLMLTAVTNYGTGSNIQYTVFPEFPPTLSLTTVTLSPTTSLGIISGKSTVLGKQTYQFTATNSTPTLAPSPAVEINVKNATFSYTTPTVPELYVGKAMTPIIFSITIPAYLDGGATELSTTYTAPDGLSIASNSTSFTLSGIPRTAGTTPIIINAVDSLSNVIPNTLVIPVTVLPDIFTFSQIPNGPYVFGQNIQITPIQVAISFSNGGPATLFLNSTLPAGLRISTSGLIEGVPTSASAANSTFQILATNGYTNAVNTYVYTTSIDTFLLYSQSGNSFTLIPKTVLETIPITSVLRSGVSPSQVTAGYLYGLTLTNTSLSGRFNSGVYPDIVVPSNASILIFGSNVSNSPSTNFQLSSETAQTKINSIAVGTMIYYSSNSFVTMIPSTGLTLNRNITDFQSAIPGGNEFMIANNSPTTYLTTNGGVSYTAITSSSGNVSEVTSLYSNWYGINTASVVRSTGGSAWGLLTSGFGQIPRADGGLVLRSVPHLLFLTPNPEHTISIPGSIEISGIEITGSSIIYRSPLPSGEFTPAFSSGFWSFSGMPAGLNFDRIYAVADGAFTLTVTVEDALPVVPFTQLSTYGTARQFDSTARLLFGGKGLRYADMKANPVANPTTCSLEEIRDVSTNYYRVIIAAGGHDSADLPNSPYSTLQYSTDIGVTWTPSTNDFTWYATNVVWGGHYNSVEGTVPLWMALGRNNTNIPGIKYSTDGITWTDITLGLTFTSSTVIGPLQFDGTNWNLFVDYVMYTHDAATATLGINGSWIVTPIAISPTAVTPAFFCSTPYISGSLTSATLGIGISSSGPVFSSPTITSYLGYQYIPISTILFDTVTDGSSFFIASTLPPGLVWSPVVLNTNGRTGATISGQPVILGTTIITVYAQNSTGISSITVTIITQPIPLKTPQTTASGYTNFMKEKVIADAAVSAINNKAFVSPVGTFLANDPRPVTRAADLCCVTR